LANITRRYLAGKMISLGFKSGFLGSRSFSLKTTCRAL